jgi:RNA polymerase sigma factor (sigma-70 family)
MITNNLNDNELVALYLSGSESSLEILIHRHKKRVYSYIKQLVKEKEIAEDVFQDTFIKVIKTLRTEKYNEEGKFLPWVMRIAHNLVIDHFRRLKKMPTTSGGDDYNIFDTLNLSEDNVQDRMVRQQIHTDVRKLIEQLPADQKEVLILRHYEELSFKEIADQTNVSINTALGRMRYALINLRKMVEDNKMMLSE